MATAGDLIKRALRIATVLASGETPTADEQNDSLVALNAMLSGWQTNKLTVYAKQTDTHTLVQGTASYTIGSGGDIDTERPERIEFAYTREGNIDYPMSLINFESYEAITQKDLESIPEELYYNMTYPLGTIALYPTPDKASTLYLTSWKELQSFSNATVSVSLPSGYEDAIAYNLAMRVSLEYGIPVRQELKMLADETLGHVKRQNTGKPRYANSEIGSLRGGNGRGRGASRFNINRGW